MYDRNNGSSPTGIPLTAGQVLTGQTEVPRFAPFSDSAGPLSSNRQLRTGRSAIKDQQIGNSSGTIDP